MAKGLSRRELKKTDILEYKKNIVCSSDNELIEFSKLEKTYLNTEARSKEYGNYFSGGLIRGGVICD